MIRTAEEMFPEAIFAVHLDHGDEETCYDCIASGFYSSVMIDASHEAFEENLPRLWADERALRQVCLNLLSNAIKFTPSGGDVWLKVGWTAAGGQYMSVKDTGPGIPEEEIPVVLSSFGQGSNAIKSAERGTGLGLPIAKNLVDMHGGTFTLKSKVRIGTELIATFPPERVMAALPPLSETAPPIQPQQPQELNTPKRERRSISRAICRRSANIDLFPGPRPISAAHLLANRF